MSKVPRDAELIPAGPHRENDGGRCTAADAERESGKSEIDEPDQRTKRDDLQTPGLCVDPERQEQGAPGKR